MSIYSNPTIENIITYPEGILSQNSSQVVILSNNCVSIKLPTLSSQFTSIFFINKSTHDILIEDSDGIDIIILPSTGFAYIYPSNIAQEWIVLTSGVGIGNFSWNTSGNITNAGSSLGSSNSIKYDIICGIAPAGSVMTITTTGVIFNKTLDLNNQTSINCPTPTTSTGIVNKDYFDKNTIRIGGNTTINTNLQLEIGTINDSDVTFIRNSSIYFSLVGGTIPKLEFFEDIDINNNKIYNCPKPIEDTEVANKIYVDNRISGDVWQNIGSSFDASVVARLGTFNSCDFDIVRQNIPLISIRVDDPTNNKGQIRLNNATTSGCPTPKYNDSITPRSYVDALFNTTHFSSNYFENTSATKSFTIPAITKPIVLFEIGIINLSISNATATYNTICHTGTDATLVIVTPGTNNINICKIIAFAMGDTSITFTNSLPLTTNLELEVVIYV
jgi:hypothetical protein